MAEGPRRGEKEINRSGEELKRKIERAKLDLERKEEFNKRAARVKKALAAKALAAKRELLEYAKSLSYENLKREIRETDNKFFELNRLLESKKLTSGQKAQFEAQLAGLKLRSGIFRDVLQTRDSESAALQKRLQEKRKKLESVNNTDELLKLVESTLKEIINDKNPRNLEATKIILSEQTKKLVSRIETEIRRGRLDLLKKRYEAITKLLHDSYELKIHGLTNLSKLQFNLGNILFPIPKNRKSRTVRPKALPKGPSKLRALPEGSSKLRALPEGSSKLKALPEGSSKLKALPEGSSKSRALSEGSSKSRALPEGSSKSRALSEGSSKLRALPEGSSKSRALPGPGRRTSKRPEATEEEGFKVNKEDVKSDVDLDSVNIELKEIKELLDEMKKTSEKDVKINDLQINELYRRINELRKYLDDEHFEESLNKILTHVKAGNEYLYNRLTMRFGPEIKDIKERLGRIENLDKQINKLLEGLNEEGKAHYKDIKTFLGQLQKNITGSQGRIEGRIEDVVNKLENIKIFFKEKDFKNLIEVIVKEAVAANNQELINALFEDSRFKAFNDYFKTSIDLLKGLKKEVLINQDLFFSAVLPRFETVLENSYQDNAKIMEVISALKEYMTKGGLENLIKDVSKKAIEENNTVLVEKIKDALPGLLGDLAKKDDIEELKKLLKNIKEGKPEGKGEGKGKPEGKGEGEGKGKPEGKDKDTKKKEEEEKKKKREILYKGLGGALSGALILALIIGLIYVISGFWRTPKSGSSGVINVTPVIGETAKTATASGSILGSLGGINPLIIVLILVALFLLFPKK